MKITVFFSSIKNECGSPLKVHEPGKGTSDDYPKLLFLWRNTNSYLYYHAKLCTILEANLFQRQLMKIVYYSTKPICDIYMFSLLPVVAPN